MSTIRVRQKYAHYPEREGAAEVDSGEWAQRVAGRRRINLPKISYEIRVSRNDGDIWERAVVVVC